MKDSFIIRKKYRNQIQKLSDRQQADLLRCMFSYQLEWEYECDDWAVCMLLDIMIDERKNDDERYLDVCEKNRENWKKWGAKKWNQNARKNWGNEQNNRAVEKQAKQTKQADNDSDNDSDILITNNLISTNVDIEQSSKWNPDINNLISQIKQMCLGLGLAYDKQKDRQFAKHILTAKEYWEFAEKIWQDRVTFALNILKASFQIKFRKWICTWPMKIYQNYADVYNETLKQHVKNQKNLIQSF